MTWQEEARENALEACMTVRDAHPRLATDADSEDVVDAIFTALAPVVAAEVARAEAQAKAEASREVRDAWQQGEWTMLTPKLPTLETRMAAAQAVTDWLSARAREVGDRA